MKVKDVIRAAHRDCHFCLGNCNYQIVVNEKCFECQAYINRHHLVSVDRLPAYRPVWLITA